MAKRVDNQLVKLSLHHFLTPTHLVEDTQLFISHDKGLHFISFIKLFMVMAILFYSGFN